jgi:hypothetical protein
MNVFEFARIVELNRAILREGESLNVSHPCSTMGTHTGTTRGLLASSPLSDPLEEIGPPL